MPNIDKIQVKYGKKLYKIMDVILSEKTGKKKTGGRKAAGGDLLYFKE